MKTTCKCGNRRRTGQRNCRECHAASMRRNRPAHRELTSEQRKRANCRSYTNVLIKRGVLAREPCTSCQKEPAQAHHEDYSKPRVIIWLCRPCHLETHS